MPLQRAIFLYFRATSNPQHSMKRTHLRQSQEVGRIQTIQVILVELLSLSVKLKDIGIGGITSRIRHVEMTRIRRDVDAIRRLHLLDDWLRLGILLKPLFHLHRRQADGVHRVLILNGII